MPEVQRGWTLHIIAESLCTEHGFACLFHKFLGITGLELLAPSMFPSCSHQMRIKDFAFCSLFLPIAVFLCTTLGPSALRALTDEPYNLALSSYRIFQRAKQSLCTTRGKTAV
jgi:hypothetical protein